MAVPCPHCACAATDDHGAHALLAMLAADDLDAALAHGLLEMQPCPGCAVECNARLTAARDARRTALAARERHRARGARLQRRKAERDAARQPQSIATTTPSLPSAAADALARALAKAKERRQ